MADVHDLGEHRRRRKNKLPAWLKDPRVDRIKDPLVRTTIAHLLDELGADPKLTTLTSSNVAHYSFQESLLRDQKMTRVNFQAAIRTNMENITGIIPKYLELSSVNRNGEISIVYIR